MSGVECGLVCSRDLDIIKKIEAFEMWLWRRMAKISWTAKVSNFEVLRRVMEDRCSSISTIKEDAALLQEDRAMPL